MRGSTSLCDYIPLIPLIGGNLYHVLEEVYFAGGYFVDGSADLDLTLLFQLLEDRTIPTDFVHGLNHIFLDHCIGKFLVGIGALARVLSSLDGRLDLLHQRSNVAHLDSFDSRLDGATILMAQYEQHFRARHFARVFQTAKHMVVYDIAGHTTDEQVSDPLVENVFHRYAASIQERMMASGNCPSRPATA